jgi:hypothetical protein
MYLRQQRNMSGLGYINPVVLGIACLLRNVTSKPYVQKGGEDVKVTAVAKPNSKGTNFIPFRTPMILTVTSDLDWLGLVFCYDSVSGS